MEHQEGGSVMTTAEFLEAILVCIVAGLCGALMT